MNPPCLLHTVVRPLSQAEFVQSLEEFQLFAQLSAAVNNAKLHGISEMVEQLQLIEMNWKKGSTNSLLL